jgi:hypothetical protein
MGTKALKRGEEEQLHTLGFLSFSFGFSSAGFLHFSASATGGATNCA